MYSAALRALGDSRAPFLAVAVSSAVNVALDILLVAVIPLGVRGAAIATVFSQAAMTVFIVAYAVKKHPPLRYKLSLRGIMSGGMAREGVRFGLPPMIQSSITAVGSLFLQSYMNSFGDDTVTAITTAYRVDTIILLPIVNLGSAVATLTAQSLGARDSGAREAHTARGPRHDGRRLAHADAHNNPHRRRAHRHVRRGRRGSRDRAALLRVHRAPSTS